MLNFLPLVCAEEKWHYFDVKTFGGVVLVTTLAFLGVLLAVGLGVYFGKREAFKKFGVAAFALSIAYSLAVGVTCFVNEIKSNSDSNQSYQLLIAIFLIVAVVLCAVSMYLLNRVKNKPDTKPETVKAINISMLAAGIAAAVATVIVFVFAIVKNEGKIDAMNTQSQTLLAVSIFLVIVTAFVFLTIIGKRKGNDTIAAVYAAITIALSFALSYVRMFKLPFGGSITLASVAPIAVYSYIFGVKRGVLCCFIYGLLQSVQDPWIVHPIQYVLDYPLAFAMFGLAGVFKGKIKKPSLAICAGIGLAAALRFSCHLFSGAIYFGSYGEAWNMSPWVYSVAYNGCYIFADAAIALAAAAVLLSSRQVLLQIKNVENKFMRDERRFIETVPNEISDGENIENPSENVKNQAQNAENTTENHEN